MSLKAEKASECGISGTAHQGVFVNSDTLVLACSSPVSLKAFNFDGAEIAFDFPIELEGKPSLYASSNKNVLYVGCMSSVYKLKTVKKIINALNVVLMTEIKVKEDFDAFCVNEEQNRIVIATQAKITIITLSPAYDVQTIVVQGLETSILPLLCVTQDRLACVSGKEVVCFSLSGQQLFRYQIPNVKNIRCVTFDPFKNVYCVCTWRRECCQCLQYSDGRQCLYCRFYGKGYELEVMNGVFKILSDGKKGQSFITKYPDAQCLFFDDYSEQFVISGENKCSFYRINV